MFIFIEVPVTKTTRKSTANNKNEGTAYFLLILSKAKYLILEIYIGENAGVSKLILFAHKY
jgi:hypothetical protein